MAADGWTIAEACDWLEPAISPDSLAGLVKANRIQPIAYRKPPPGSAGGRPAPVYPIQVLIDVHAANERWLVEAEPQAAQGC